MTFAISLLAAILVIREFMFMKERSWAKKEREDLYNRIQAGSLQEYKQNDVKAGPAVLKDREQKIAEETSRRGIPRSDLQYPSHWKG